MHTEVTHFAVFVEFFVSVPRSVLEVHLFWGQNTEGQE